MRRRRIVATSIAISGMLIAVFASSANARTTTLHFFSKGVYSTFTGPLGQPLPPNSPPAIGDRLSFASNDYRGNHRHHARHATASDHVDCTIVSATTGICDGQIQIGHSMILADNFTIDFTSSVTIAKITGGTNRYRNAGGTVVAKNIGTTSNSDLTITIRR